VATGLGSDAGLADLSQAVGWLRTVNGAIADRMDGRARQIAEGESVA